MAETMRCFIAVNVPEEIKKKIFESVSKKIPKDSCKLVAQENLHVTMLFLGNLTEQAVSEAREKMRALSTFKAFDAELSGIGNFHARVFWVGIVKGQEELEAIADVLQKEFGVQEEDFHAHLTVARNKFLKSAEADALLKELEKEKFSLGFRVETIDFMQSVLSPSGPSYKKLFSIALGKN